MRSSFFLLLPLAAFAQSPEQRAVDYLARETPRWSRENGCFSCHNNGDGARALYAASRRGYKVPAEALADTTAWLLEPGGWDNNKGNPGFSDKKLARIQFAAALAEAAEAGVPGAREALTNAAASLISHQDSDGSWKVDVGQIGSPATYGTALATHMARSTLKAAYEDRFNDALIRSSMWLLRSKPRATPELAAVLLALPIEEPDVRRCLDLLLAAQAGDGGWGPFPMSPTEPFDTAIAVLALRNLNQPRAVAKARAYLISQQQPSGGWIETTRPAGGHSYAQHISTTGWAALALILPDSER